MPEEISASTEAAPASTSTTGEATSASSAGAGEQAAQAQAADPNVSAAPESQIDIGWSLEDKPEETVLPENDDDIQELLKDPALDPARTPGLVTALRSARQQAVESRKQVAELRQQLTQLEQFGGLEGVNQAMGSFNELLTDPRKGLASLYDTAYPVYEQIVNHVIASHGDYVIEQLQQAGRLPATQTSAGQLTAEDWARIPQEMREIAKQVPTNQLIEWLDKGTDESLAYNLSREAKLQQLDTTQRQQAERQWREQSQEAQKQGQESLNKISDQYQKAHFSELSKWKPFGPDNEPQNQMVYKMAWEGAFADLMSDQKFGQMYTDAYNLLKDAPMRRLKNEGLAADQDERKARQMAAQVNTRLGQILRERVKLLDGIARDARAYRESQRSEIPQRTEISGVSSSVGSNGEPPRLTKDGRINSSWTDWMISRLPGMQSR